MATGRAALLLLLTSHAAAARYRYLLDKSWRFQLAPSGAPKPAHAACTMTWCQQSTDDSSWRSVNLPHDYTVEFNFSQSADTGQGSLPRESAYYRKHIVIPAEAAGANDVFIEFEGIQTRSVVFLNGKFLGNWTSGYTASHYHLSPSSFAAGDNVLAVFTDGDYPDGWW